MLNPRRQKFFNSNLFWLLIIGAGVYYYYKRGAFAGGLGVTNNQLTQEEIACLQAVSANTPNECAFETPGDPAFSDWCKSSGVLASAQKKMNARAAPAAYKPHPPVGV